MLNSSAMVAIFVIFVNNCHPRWLTNVQVEDWFKFSVVQIS